MPRNVAREPKGPSKVYPVKTPSTGQVAKALREESARRSTPEDLCTLTDKADGEELLAITVPWTPQSPPSGRSVRYTATVGPEDAGRLLVACDIGGGGGTESGASGGFWGPVVPALLATQRMNTGPGSDQSCRA
ncbi:hypothetical protein [Streptomyces sp. MK37H]|uniref:hypothetical protein n=1 Tax=Streptomyces sp. MK37H TaxID=2699117 RepID=UPI001B36B972|nr:hypothetical protein [Streptomyces sp. MK37H]MBP8533060.1 hypothetical protein [Streptomyces sp. MK37H]